MLKGIYHAFFSAKVLLIISWVLLIGGICGMVLSQLGLIARGEPKFVLQLSWLAIVVSGYGNILIAKVNKDNDNNAKT